MTTFHLVKYLIIDWGTTNFRAFAMSADDQLVDTLEKPLGLLQVERGDFAAALEQTLKNWLPAYQELPIYMAGMVGSMKGWVNVDYAATPAGAKDIVTKAHSFHVPWGAKATIFPGVSHQYQELNHDVMRGEEVQLLGLTELLNRQNFEVILPGTHSKHASLCDGVITEFASYLTGEFFSMLTRHSLLGKDLPSSDSFCEASFVKGVNDGQDGALTNKIFLGWTHRLFNQLKPEQVKDYLSGMLIGYELGQCRAKSIYLVGGKDLCQRYQIAANKLTIKTEIMNGNNTFLAGMSVLIQAFNSREITDEIE